MSSINLQVFRARIAPSNVERLLAVRDAAIAEAQRLCPELLRADLVRCDGETWLDVLTWSVPDGEERLMRAAEDEDTPALDEMHGLITEVLGVERGEVVRTSAAADAEAGR